MSLQHALLLIRKLRDNPSPETNSTSNFEQLIKYAEREGLPCTKEHLQKAFVLDWQMRWLKAQQPTPLEEPAG